MPFLPMQVLPPLTGGTPITTQLTQSNTTWTGNFQQDLNNFINAANAAGDTQLATEFRAYALQEHSKHPTLTVKQLLSAFIGTQLAGGLSTTIGQTGTLLGQVPGAAAKGAENAFHGLNLGSWFLRIGEILLGLVLIGVGVARLTGAQNAISKIVRTKLPI